MKTKYLNFIILSFIIIGSLVLTNQVFAQEPTGAADIQYPVKELGNCQDKTSCKTYCDKPENTEACVSFAEKNNLMSKDEIDTAKKFVASGSKGPGGCAGKDACETYCDNISHIDECVSYAEKNNLMPPKNLAQAKQVQAAIARGVKPPPCKNKKECDSYCEDPNNMEKCVTFGVEAGFIQGKELEDSQKMLAALKRGVKPPPCKGKEACDQYCGEPNNMEVCTNFAIEAGFMTDQEKADSQKMLAAIKQGIKPPACKGKEACDAYCSQDAHFEECTKFAEAAGFISKEDAVMVRKTGGKGPGGCKSKNECDTFCNNPNNQETCFNFGKENGMIPEADLKQMEQGKQQFKETLNQAPQAVLECLNSQLGTDIMEKFKSGTVMPPREIGNQMRTCFEKGMGQPGGPQQGQGGPQNGQDQQNQNQQNQQIQPWADMCSSDGNGNPTALACVDGSGKFITSAKVGSDGKPVCPADSTAKCGNYQQNNQQGQPGQNQQGQPEDKFQPGPGAVNPGGQIMTQQAGPGGCKGPEECQKYCSSNPDECKNFQPGQQGQIQTQQQQQPTGNQQPPTQQNMPPQGQQPQQGMTNPPEGMTPTVNQQPPAGNIAPPSTPTTPPPANTTPPPSGFLNLESFLGSITRIFTETLQQSE
ncbi:MAG: hypothetical protein Q8N22_00635 [bacterium]|nr:hypothetical protein [bacterium]